MPVTSSQGAMIDKLPVDQMPADLLRDVLPEESPLFLALTPPGPRIYTVSLDPGVVIDFETGAKTTLSAELMANGGEYDWALYQVGPTFNFTGALFVTQDLPGGATTAAVYTDGEKTAELAESLDFADGWFPFGFIPDPNLAYYVREPDGDLYLLSDFSFVSPGTLTFTVTDFNG